MPNRFLQPECDVGRHGRMQGIMSEQGIGVGEFQHPRLMCLLLANRSLRFLALGLRR